VNLLKLFGVLSGLSGTDRFSNAKLIHRESVLEHTGGVSLTCYLLCRELESIAIGSIDPKEVMYRAAIHDVEELLTGDLPRVFKHRNQETKAMFKQLGNDAMDRIVNDLDLISRGFVLDDYDRAKDGAEGLIVAIADCLAVVYKVHEESVERGNLSIMSRASSSMNQIVALRTMVEEVFLAHPPVIEFLDGVLSDASDVIAHANSVRSATAIEER